MGGLACRNSGWLAASPASPCANPLPPQLAAKDAKDATHREMEALQLLERATEVRTRAGRSRNGWPGPGAAGRGVVAPWAHGVCLASSVQFRQTLSPNKEAHAC